VARKAIERRTGGRGLRSIMEGILLGHHVRPARPRGVENVVIGPEVVEGKARPLLHLRGTNEKTGASSASVARRRGAFARRAIPAESAPRVSWFLVASRVLRVACIFRLTARRREMRVGAVPRLWLG